MEFNRDKMCNIFIDKELFPLLQTIPLRVSIDKIPAILGDGKEGVLFLALGTNEVVTISEAFESRNLSGKEPKIEISKDGVATIKDTTIKVPTISIIIS